MSSVGWRVSPPGAFLSGEVGCSSWRLSGGRRRGLLTLSAVRLSISALEFVTKGLLPPRPVDGPEF